MNVSAPRTLLCYAYGHEGSWQGICVDFDIAVQGASFEEVQQLLREATRTYIEDAQQETEETQKYLLSRNAPFHVKVGLAVRFLLYILFRKSDGDQQANFSITCPA